MMPKMIFYWFLIGFVIGFVIIFSTTQIVVNSKSSSHINKFRMAEATNERNVSSSNSIRPTVEDVKKIRILCFLGTMPKTHSTRAAHILQTWGKHCDKLIFFSTVTDVNLGAIGFNVTDNHGHVWGKLKLVMQYIYKNFINDYDWFIKGDDDTFLYIENLRYMLSAYSTDDPIYFGYKKISPGAHKRGYFSGGAGYVLSRQTVRTFAEKVLTNKTFYKEIHEGGCNLNMDKRNEDWDLTICLDNYDVYLGDSRDFLKRERFFSYYPSVHLLVKYNESEWNDGFWSTKYYWDDEGLDCCSNYTISFHYIDAKYNYQMYFLAYKLKLFGIKKQYPPPPLKANFSHVIERLEKERVDISLRGF